MTSYSWIIFDADGTLFDFRRAEASALEKTPTGLGLQVPEEFCEIYHAINDALWRRFEAGDLSARDVRTQRFEQLFRKLQIDGEPNAFSKAFLKNLICETTFLPGAAELLAVLGTRSGLLLLTNGFADVQHARIERLRLKDTFDHVIISEEVGVAKPDRDIFDIAFERMGCPSKSHVLIVGDSLSSDIRGGADYGIDTCWFNPDLLINTTRIEPTYEINHLRELDDLLSRENSRHG